MKFSMEARRARIDELLPRFPEASEMLSRYRELLDGDPAPAEQPEDGTLGQHAATNPARCPACGGAPGLAFLLEEPETHGGARRLVCSRCETSWPFPRIVCPGCGEEKTERQPRFQAEEIPAARIDACDSCGRYLKSIDLTRDARAVPAVDDLATCALDFAARERGYRRMDDA